MEDARGELYADDISLLSQRLFELLVSVGARPLWVGHNERSSESICATS